MTGIYGAGRAFNLKYRPNGPMKVFVTDRRPIFNFFGGGCRGAHYGGGYDMMSSSTYIEYKPNFWDNLSSIIQSGVSAFCMLGSMGVFNKKADGVEGKPKPQGATSPSNLEKLQRLAKARDLMVEQEPGDEETYAIMDKKAAGGKRKLTFDEAVDYIQNFSRNKPTTQAASAAEPAAAAPAAEPAAEGNDEIKANSALTATQAQNLKTGTNIKFIDEAKQLSNGNHNTKTDVKGTIETVGKADKNHSNFPETFEISTKFGTVTATLVNVDDKTNDAIYRGNNSESYRLRADAQGNIILVQHKDDESLGAKAKIGNSIFK